MLAQEQKKDEMLQQFQEWADREENGCYYSNGLLMQKEQNETDEPLTHIVVPTQ